MPCWHSGPEELLFSEMRGNPQKGRTLEEGWTHFFPMDNDVTVPAQLNAYDCGVFCCMFAARLSLPRSSSCREQVH